MQTQDTSLNAYHTIVLPRIGSRQRAVFDVLKANGSVTNSELAKLMCLSINQITPRTNELRKLNLVEEAGKRVCKVTGLVVHTWRVKTQIVPVFRNPDVEMKVYAEPRQLQMI